MQILNIAAYKFIALDDLSTLRQTLLTQCLSYSLKGTILLSIEGININLAGTEGDLLSFWSALTADPRFNDLAVKKSYSAFLPFKRLKVKLKKEIITLRQPAVKPIEQRAPAINPSLLKQWLDEKKEFTLLDTRNDYEVAYGTFKEAVNLHLSDFCEFPEAAKQLHRDKPIVMFCTGGIRCEKAALHLLNEGYDQVYQLEGGILNYFEEMGSAHYDGGCFVFDERTAVDPALKATRTSEG